MDNLVGKELSQHSLFWKRMFNPSLVCFNIYFLHDILSGSEGAYYERSPINFDNKFTCPVILFQGLDDKVGPDHQPHILS